MRIYFAPALLIGMLTCITTHLHARHSELSITPFRLFKQYKNPNQASDKHIILCCKLRIKRRGTPLKLTHLRLQWHPDHPDIAPPQHLIPTLYRARHRQAFKPVSDNMVSSGTWHKPTRSIHFMLNKKLIGTHYFFVVVYADTQDAHALQQGRFTYTDELPLVTRPHIQRN